MLNVTTPEPSRRLWSRAGIRLDLAAYAESGTTWLVTCTTFARGARHLADPELSHAVVETVRHSLALNRCRVLAYCLMPDHVHAVSVVDFGGDLVRAMNSFKSYSTKLWWAHGGQGQLWQRSFRDRGLRTVSDIEAAIVYVQENPLQAGLIDDVAAYPWVGGELLSPA